MEVEEKRAEARRSHVLAVPFPFHGHINPLLYLCRELAAHDHGIVVSFLNAPHYHARMPASPTPANLRFLSLPFSSCMVPPDMRVPGSLLQCMLDIDLRMGEEVEGVMEGLMRQEDFPRLTCLIADIWLPFAQALADKYCIPRVAFWTQSAATLVCQVKVYRGSYQLPEDEEALVESIGAGVPRHRVRETPLIWRRDVVDEVVYEFFRRPFVQPGLRRAAAVVINTIEELEEATVRELERELKEEGRKPEVLSVVPLNRQAAELESTGRQLEHVVRHEALRWLDARAPASVLYVCFGTFICLSRPEFENLAVGIEASGTPFLWALRPDMVAGADEDDVAVFTEAFRERTRDRGLVVPWTPQPLVLAHPSVGGFLSHCGWNSTLDAISAGVPVLCRPKFVDQPLNMRCIVDAWRFGLALENDDEAGGSLSARHVELQIRCLMQSEGGLRQNAAALKEAASRAMGKGGSSVANLRPLVRLIKDYALVQNECNMEKDVLRST